MSDQRITSGDIKIALNKYFPAPEWAVAFEVAQGTGAKAHRHLDAIAMNTWPSRGMSINGIEIKVSLYDWRKELKTPDKAEQIARYCDFFYIAAPRDLIPMHEIPTAWGLLEYENGKLRQKKPAEKTSAEPVNRDFLAAMCRAMTRPVDDAERQKAVQSSIDDMQRTMEENFNKRLDDRLKSRLSDYEADAKAWRQIAPLVSDNGFIWNDDIIKAIKFVRQTGIANSYNNLMQIVLECARFKDKIEKAATDIGIPLKEPNA